MSNFLKPVTLQSQVNIYLTLVGEQTQVLKKDSNSVIKCKESSSTKMFDQENFVINKGGFLLIY